MENWKNEKCINETCLGWNSCLIIINNKIALPRMFFRVAFYLLSQLYFKALYKNFVCFANLDLLVDTSVYFESFWRKDFVVDYHVASNLFSYTRCQRVYFLWNFGKSYCSLSINSKVETCISTSFQNVIQSINRRVLESFCAWLIVHVWCKW